MALSAPEGLKGLRDRALLLGFAGAFRRSELVALDVADLEETAIGGVSPNCASYRSSNFASLPSIVTCSLFVRILPSAAAMS